MIVSLDTSQMVSTQAVRVQIKHNFHALVKQRFIMIHCPHQLISVPVGGQWIGWLLIFLLNHQ